MCLMRNMIDECTASTVQASAAVATFAVAATEAVSPTVSLEEGARPARRPPVSATPAATASHVAAEDDLADFEEQEQAQQGIERFLSRRCRVPDRDGVVAEQAARGG